MHRVILLIALVSPGAAGAQTYFSSRSWTPIGDTADTGGSEAVLLGGTVALMPALTSALINFVKNPR